MNQNRRSLGNQLGNVVGMGLLLTPIILYGIPHFLRPVRAPETRSLFQGIDYRREVRVLPRPIVIHIVTIDLTAPGIRAFVTPGSATSDGTETNARITSKFLSEFSLKLAVNANFFYHFREETPWDYFPHAGDRVNNVGQAISDEQLYSVGETNWAALCLDANQRAKVVEKGTCPAETTQAVAGDKTLIKAGKAVSQPGEPDKPYPRSVVATDAKGQTLWLILVDGKQRLYSEGMTIAEVTEFVRQLGVDTALNLDGGGSVTLAVAALSGTKLLNSPVQNKIPMNERPIANHLGFYAKEN